MSQDYETDQYELDEYEYYGGARGSRGTSGSSGSRRSSSRDSRRDSGKDSRRRSSVDKSSCANDQTYVRGYESVSVLGNPYHTDGYCRDLPSRDRSRSARRTADRDTKGRSSSRSNRSRSQRGGNRNGRKFEDDLTIDFDSVDTLDQYGGADDCGRNEFLVKGYRRDDGTDVHSYCRKFPDSVRRISKVSQRGGEDGCGRDEIRVRGYTRSDGTYVDPYCRDMRDSNTSRRSRSQSRSRRQRGGASCGPNEIAVDGYRRSDGTYVDPYCRADWGTGDSERDAYERREYRKLRDERRQMGGANCGPGEIAVDGYIRDDGTVVDPYCRADWGTGDSERDAYERREYRKLRDERRGQMGGASCGSGEILVDGYTRDDGTYVDPYCRADWGTGDTERDGYERREYRKLRDERNQRGGANCGPGEIAVDGYTRDDGTYVDPYCRADWGTGDSERDAYERREYRKLKDERRQQPTTTDIEEFYLGGEKKNARKARY